MKKSILNALSLGLLAIFVVSLFTRFTSDAPQKPRAAVRLEPEILQTVTVARPPGSGDLSESFQIRVSNGNSERIAAEAAEAGKR